MRTDTVPNHSNPPLTIGSRETWLCQAAPPPECYGGLLETGGAVCTWQILPPCTPPGGRTVPAALSDPCLWFPCANSPLCVDLFGMPLVDSSLYASCHQCTSSASAFCEGSRVAFPVEACTSVACGACCRCMSVVVRRAQWSVVTGESFFELSSLVYDVTMLRHHSLRLKKAPACATGATSPTRAASFEGDSLQCVPRTQSDALSFTNDAVARKTTSKPVKPQLPPASSGQPSVDESMQVLMTARPCQLGASEVRLAAEQRPVLPFFFYAFLKACQAERQVVRDLWLYFQFTAARTRPVRLWKDCKRCCARHPPDTADVGRAATTSDEQNATSCLPEEETGRWWSLAHVGPDGLCGCFQTAESEAAELTRWKGESRSAYRERMYLLALQRWLMGNDLRAMGDVLMKVIDETPEDFCALTLGTRFLLVAGGMHTAVRICTKPNVIKALGHCPFLWSLVAFAADQSALPRNVAEMLSYRAARLAVSLCPSDVHAHHALLHVFLVKGYFADSLRLAQTFHRAWARYKGFMQHHLWWHVAVVLVETHQFCRAMQLFWTQVYPPEKQEGWDNHNGALQLLLRLKILHSWSRDFCANQLLQTSETKSYCSGPRPDKASTHESQTIKAILQLHSGAEALTGDVTLALHQVVLRIKLEEEKARNTSHTYGRGHVEEDTSCNLSSATPRAIPSAPTTFLRGPSAVGLSVACYIAALALATPRMRLGNSALTQASTSACSTAGDFEDNSVGERIQNQGRQSLCYCATVKQADEELRRLQEEVVPFLAWKVRSSHGQTWISVGKAFKAWADGDFATSAKLLHPLLLQDLAACAARENIHQCPVSVTQAERGVVTPQAQKELVEEALFAAEDADHKASLHARGNAENSSVGISCFEHLCASREQAELVVLVFLDAFYQIKKNPLGRRSEKICGALCSVLDNSVDMQMETTVSKILERKLSAAKSPASPLLHIYVSLCNTVCAVTAHSPANAINAQLHGGIACELIRKYAEEEMPRGGGLAWA